MRTPSNLLDRRTPVDLQLTPMIDCVFLLMVYFIWTSSFAITEQLLPSQLSLDAPSSAAGESDLPPPPEADFEEVVVRILWEAGGPNWTVNDSPVASLAELRGTLQTIADIKRDAPVILHPDPKVPLGEVIRVFDLSRLVGFEKVRFAATDNT
jgi:biopolymer transport protein ExbD